MTLKSAQLRPVQGAHLRCARALHTGGPNVEGPGGPKLCGSSFMRGAPQTINNLHGFPHSKQTDMVLVCEHLDLSW